MILMGSSWTNDRIFMDSDYDGIILINMRMPCNNRTFCNGIDGPFSLMIYQ